MLLSGRLKLATLLRTSHEDYRDRDCDRVSVSVTPADIIRLGRRTSSDHDRPSHHTETARCYRVNLTDS